MYLLTQKRPQGDLRATNRQDSTDPAVVVGPSISRTRKITFPAPSTSRSDLLGQLSMRVIGVGGLASRRSKRAVLSCLLRAEQAPRATEALHITALLSGASHLFCHVPDEEPYRKAVSRACGCNVLLGPDILCARVDAT